VRLGILKEILYFILFYFILFTSFFLLENFFIYISNVIPKVPYTLPLPCSPTNPLLLLALAFPCIGAYDLGKTKGLYSH
jgi:hypothetical protein